MSSTGCDRGAQREVVIKNIRQTTYLSSEDSTTSASVLADINAIKASLAAKDLQIQRLLETQAQQRECLVEQEQLLQNHS
jgi:hypothetical protein